MYVGAVNATLRGLTIIGTHAAGDSPGGADLDCNVLMADGGHITLDHCTLIQAGHCGVKPARSGVTMIDCVIEDGGFTLRDHGIYVSEAGAIIIRGTAIQRMTGYAVHLFGVPSGAVIEDCIFDDNGRAIISGGGVLMDGNGGNQITRCQITNNHGYGGLVFYQSLSINNVITDCVITGNANADVVLDHAVQPQTESGNTVGTYWTNTDYAAWPH